MNDPLPPVPSAAPVPGAFDQVFIEGFRVDTVIGIDPGELGTRQPLVVDVQAGLAQARAGDRACDSDRIADTIHYGHVLERLRRLMAEHRIRLLEALAERIAEILIAEFGAVWVRVRVVKPRKFDDVAAVGVQIERIARTAPGPSGRAGR